MKKIILFFLLLSTNVFAESIRLISVSGIAEKSFEPDMAKILINLWGKAENAKSAQSMCQGQYELLKKTLEANQIGNSDIQTVGYELTPDYVFDNKTSTNKIVGFNANQTIRVNFKKVPLLGKFLDTLNSDTKNLKAGTNIQSVSWDLIKRDEIEKSLLADSVKMAESEAKMLAEAAHVKIKGLYFLSPTSGNNPIPVYPMNEGMMMKSARGGSAQATSLFSGEVKVTSSVSAQYEIN